MSQNSDVTKTPENGEKNRKSPQKGRNGKGLERDVTRDAVIITRDLGVIGNHTGHRSQGHKMRNKP